MVKSKLLILLFVLIPLQIFSQWMWHNPSPTGNDLRDIHFIDLTNGFLISDFGEYFETTDGGENWEFKNIGNYTGFYRFFFVNSQIGFICGNNGLILKTIDGGENWESQITNITETIFSIYFVDPLLGFAVAHNGLFLKTTNGGEEWFNKVISSGSYNWFNDIYFINADTGIAVHYGDVFRTTNGGDTWSSQIIYEDWFRIDFPSDSVGYIAGRGGEILKTTNSGISWVEIQTITYKSLRTLKFFNDSTGYFFGGTLLKTTDGGENWIQLSEPTPFTTIYSQYFFNEFNGIIVGQGGRMFSTTDGGISWVNFYDGLQTNLSDLHFINDTSGFVITGSSLLKSNDYFKNWKVKLTAPSSMYEYSFPREQFGYLIGSAQVYKSTDYGETWFVKSDLPGAFSIDFVNQWLGFCVGQNRRIWKTTDGGDLWIQVNVPGSFDLTSIDMFDALRGCAVGMISMTYYSLDGGDTWIFKWLYPPEVQFRKVKMYDQSFGLASGLYGQIYKTNSTGSNWTSKPSPVTTSLNDIHFINRDTVYIVGKAGVIIVSTDAGESWTQQPSPTYKDLYSVDFVNSQLGFIVGDDGVILRYGDLPTSIDNFFETTTIPSAYVLSQNYPNPFNPTTTIGYEIPERSFVTLKVYDVLGNEIAALVNKEKPAGSYEIEFGGVELPSGIYFYRLQAGSIYLSKKMILLK